MNSKHSKTILQPRWLTITDADWITRFDTKWELTDWFTEYATVYAKPEYDSFDNHYQGFIDAGSRPDFFLNFPQTPLTACFVQHGEDLEALSREFSPRGRLASYIDDPGHGYIEDKTGSEQKPEIALIATQFSPFGRLLADDSEITNFSLNSILKGTNPDDDFMTHFLALQLGQIDTAMSTGMPDSTITQYGVLVGKQTDAQTFKRPAALTNDIGFNDPTWLDLVN